MTTPTDLLPKTCDVLVIGGGPAGSSVAALLARDGIDVLLLDKARHPRPQVGESLIPHFWKYTDLVGVSEALENEGFVAKSGGITVWDGKIHRISFADFGFTRPALHVERDRFDHILLDHARSSGARVIEDISVKDVDFGDPARPLAQVIDKRSSDARQASVRCRYVVDAGGHGSVLANQFRTRRLIDSRLKFLSLWGYFENSRFLSIDGKSHGSGDLSRIRPVTFVLSFEEGWIWHIPLRRVTSVGLVINTERTKGFDRRARERFFLDTCATEPYLRDLLKPATYIENSLNFRPDYSYYSTRLCGENWYCIGDAAAFVDPIYSHGVLNAFYSAAIASLAIKESLKDPTRRERYSSLCESRMQQFYGFSRSLALGDFGGDGVDPALVKSFMRSVPPVELELMLAASHISSRSQNFRRLAQEAGVIGDDSPTPDKAKLLQRLEL